MKTSCPQADFGAEPLPTPQQALRESEQRYRSIVDSAFDAIISMDHRGLITEFNPAAEGMFGWKRQQVIGRDLSETLIPPALREAHRRGLERHRGSPQASTPCMRLELSALHASGNEFPIELSVSRVAGGVLPRFTAIIRNLTARRAGEAKAQLLAVQLKASESQYRSLFVDNPQPMYVYEPQTLRFLAVNKACVVQYGFGEAEFLRMTLADLRPPEEREVWERDVMCQPFHGQQRHNARHRRTNGEILEVEVLANDIQFQGRPARVALAIDVTEHRRAAADLRRSEARFRALTELSADWFWEQDENFRFVGVQGGRYPSRVAPYSALIGKTRWEVAGTPFEGGWDAHRAQVERREPFRDFEVRRAGEDGSVRVFSLTGSPIFDDDGRFAGYRGLGRDITERRRAEEALRESQRALSALMSNLPGMAYRCRNDGRWTLEFASEGAQKWVWERGSSVRGPDGQVVALEGFVSDITEHRRAEDEVARLNAQLEERVKQRTAQLEAANAELEAFSYSIAHDLRSPLTSIDGFSHTLHELCGDALGEQGRHYLGRIRAGVRQMSDLTDAMLSLARLSRVKLRSEKVDLAALARSALAQLREAQPQRDAAFEAPDHLDAHGDPRLLAQVVTNLIGNAWKFSAGKPQTRVRMGSKPGDKGETVYFVADQGAGFDMAYAARLFGAFQRLHAPSEFEGTGIGLALVQKIVARHGGRIWAEARAGEGAVFYFTLGGEPAP